MKKKLLVFHGGAPTAVMNASLCGAIAAAGQNPEVGGILAARFGTGGILSEDFIDLTNLPQGKLDLLLATPASAIGTSRDHLEPGDYEKIAGILKKHNIGWVLGNGGNGSMDTCGKIFEAAGGDIAVGGIPKTIDNDIAVTDHSPGFGSAARYIAATVREICADVRSLPIHVCIVEAMGRNAGWITAAAALARKSGLGPDLICLPERPFDKEAFLKEAQRLHKEKGGVVVVVSEGLRDKAGNPVAKPIFEAGRSLYYGDVGAELAAMVIENLGIKARSEKPGIAGRASAAWQSKLDREEAFVAGREAAKAVLSGKTGVMAGFRRLDGAGYSVENILIPISEVMLHERVMPDSFIAESGFDVTQEFVDWCEPLIGGPLPEFAQI